MVDHFCIIPLDGVIFFQCMFGHCRAYKVCHFSFVYVISIEEGPGSGQNVWRSSQISHWLEFYTLYNGCTMNDMVAVSGVSAEWVNESFTSLRVSLPGGSTYRITYTSVNESNDTEPKDSYYKFNLTCSQRF